MSTETTATDLALRESSITHRSPVNPAVTVVNASNDDLLAELAYRNVATATMAARAALRDRAGSYAKDARIFADLPGLVLPESLAAGNLTEEDCKRYATIYRTIADELRKVADSL